MLQPLSTWGVLGVAFGGLAGLMPRRRLILVCSGLGSACLSLQNLMLGSTTGAALCTLAVLQSLAASSAPEEDRPRWLLAFLGLASFLVVAVTVSTWQGWLSLCAGLGSLLSVCARLQGDPQRMRRAFLVSSLFWAGHDGSVGSVCGLLNDTLTVTGHLYGLWQNRERRATPTAMGLQPA
jgi:Bacterial inner membrane protein